MSLTEQGGYFSIKQFLKLYKAPDNIKSTITQYLTFTYPEHQGRIKKGNNLDTLDRIGKQYIDECKAGRNWGIDLLNYKNSDIIGRGGSVNSKISRVRVWLDWNNLPLSPRLSKTLYDPSTSRITSNYAPTRDEIKRICDHLDLPYKTLTLILVSSGSRCGSETMQWRIRDIDWRHDPVRIFQVPSRPPKNRAPFILRARTSTSFNTNPFTLILDNYFTSRLVDLLENYRIKIPSHLLSDEQTSNIQA